MREDTINRINTNLLKAILLFKAYKLAESLSILETVLCDIECVLKDDNYKDVHDNMLDYRTRLYSIRTKIIQGLELLD